MSPANNFLTRLFVHQNLQHRMKLLALLTLVAELTVVAAYKMPPLDPKLAKIAVGKKNKVDIVEVSAFGARAMSCLFAII